AWRLQLVPVVHASRKPIVEVIPIGICREDQTHLPGAWPMLHIALALNSSANIRVMFYEHQPLQTVSLSETVSHTFSVLPGATGKITGNPGIESTVGPVCYDVDPSALHRVNLRKRQAACNAPVDGRHKAGHDEGNWFNASDV